MSPWGAAVYAGSLGFAAVAVVVILLRFVSDTGLWKLRYFPPIGSDDQGDHARVRDFLTIFAILAGSRIFFLAAGSLGIWGLHGFSMGPLPGFESVWNRWDSPHYLDLARDGYTNQGDPQNFIVFLPLYPALVWVFHLVTGNYFAAALVGSNLCLLGAGWLLREVVTLDQGREAGIRAVWFLALAPFGFFMGLGFSEALFLAVTLGGYWAARKGWWWTAGLFLFLATLTRVQGVLLAVPLFVELLLAPKKPLAGFLCFGGAVLGLGVYFLINLQVFGDPFHFLVVEREHWYQSWGFFAENLKNHLTEAANRGPTMAMFLWVPQVCAFFLVVGLCIAGTPQIRSSLAAYLLVFALVSYSPTWLLSGNRYLSVAFPVYVILALFTKNRWIFPAVLAISAALAVFFTFGYVEGSSVM